MRSSGGRVCAALLCGLFLGPPAHAGSPDPGTRAPPLAVVDVLDRPFVVPVPGRVTLLFFASPANGEAMGEIARALRVAHPELEIISFIDVSGYPRLAHGFVRRAIAKRHGRAVADTRDAFVRAGKTPPEDLDARIHIVPDFEAANFERYGAGGSENQPCLVLVDADGRIASGFDKSPRLADVEAALSALHAEAPGGPRR